MNNSDIGIHYDPLILKLGNNRSMKIFDKRLQEEDITKKALCYVASQKEKRKYTDTAQFTLRCNICQKGFKGQHEAIRHATETGHQNFVEY